MLSHHPLHSLSHGECTTMLGRHPSRSLSCGECMTMLSRHPSRLLLRGGTTMLGHHPPPNLLHPSRLQSHRGCTTTLGCHHHPSRLQSCEGCAAMFSHYPPLALAVVWGCTMFGRYLPPLALTWGVYHDAPSPPTRYTPHARNCMGGVPRRLAATHHPSCLQSCGGCSTTFGCHSPPPHACNCMGGVQQHSATTSATPHARNHVRGVPRPTTHLQHPSHSQVHGGCIP
jgi:hypothetical protein